VHQHCPLSCDKAIKHQSYPNIKEKGSIEISVLILKTNKNGRNIHFHLLDTKVREKAVTKQESVSFAFAIKPAQYTNRQLQNEIPSFHKI